MKTFAFFLGLTLTVCLHVQASDVTTLSTPDNVEESTNTSKFSFTVYGEIPEAKVDFAQPHFLGQPVEAKWNTFLKNYTLVSQQSIGFSSTNVQFNKPVIYNAVQKVNKYLKKSVKKGLVTKTEAADTMNHVLDCANVVCFEPDTKAFEEALADAKTREDIIRVFENTELVFR